MGVIVVGGIVTPVPFAPTLLTPSAFSWIDLTQPQTFSWQYNPGQLGKTQTAYQLYITINGTTTWFWNGSGWQSTPVWVATSNTSITFNGNSIPGGNGNLFQWSVACQDANGSGPAATPRSFNAQANATVTMTSPIGVVPYADPLVSWTATFPSLASQQSYRVVIYNQAQYGAVGFVPGSGASVLDTGTVASPNGYFNMDTLPFYLPNNTQYRAYLQLTETGGSAGQVSPWVYSSFSVYFTGPKAPTIVAVSTTDPGTQYPIIQLQLTGNDNRLSLQDANPATGRGTWQQVSNTTLGTNSTYGLSMTAVGAGAINAQTAIGAGGYSIAPNTQFTAIASFLAVATARSCYVTIEWYTATGAFISAVQGSTVTDNTVSPTQSSVVATSPSNAAYAAVLVTVLGASAAEVHYVSSIGIFNGTDTIWGPGGFFGLTSAIIQRSDGLYVRNASIGNPAHLK